MGGNYLGQSASSGKWAKRSRASGLARVASRKGQDVEFMAGDIIAVRLDEVVTVETEMVGLAGS